MSSLVPAHSEPQPSWPAEPAIAEGRDINPVVNTQPATASNNIGHSQQNHQQHSRQQPSTTQPATAKTQQVAQ